MVTTTKPSAIGGSDVGAVADNAEGMARRFWIKFSKNPTLALYTSFVVCLASGNLKLDTFWHYIASNVHFLKAFAQAAFDEALDATIEFDIWWGIYIVNNTSIDLRALLIHIFLKCITRIDDPKETVAPSSAPSRG
ncbi:hypothetical protein LOK49_LG14G00419 [Camellia lanceoleosa]|uniref:Uncharacterized protein n=1 Tax=Camellia lanceoleosa TaxID=1840588 RepID=A0ACC0F891_9ERIC|nr:hypothetical protein LOK49_LG14G00419 [Camellia lanceoleosa]